MADNQLAELTANWPGIRGWLKGFNRAYVNGTGSNWFGMDLGYDYGYITNQLNGNISGMKWKSKGDPVARAYGFGYDNVNRLLKGDFTQDNGSGFVKDAQVDLNLDKMSYDANGNILLLQQKGLILNASQVIDRLVYAYQQAGGVSNKLASVTDSSTNTAPLGDFKDGTNTGDDYNYNGNGNLVLDNNKKISSINYNLLNLPASIAINGKGTIRYIYDATGNKLKKITIDSTLTPVKTTTTTYSGAYVYNNDTLQLVNHEEGRIRPKLIVPASGYIPSNIQYVYDYFIKDHLGNTRMVLTEETDQATYAATMESANAIIENQLFDSVSTTQLAKPAGFDTDTSNHYVSRLNASSSVNKIVGPAILLKVMAGDTLTASTYGWYNAPVQAPVSNNLLNSLLPTLTNGAIGTSGGHLILAQKSAVNNAFASSLPTLLSVKDAAYNSSQPKAFLNWALFDERFNYVSGGVTQVQIINGGDYKKAIAANLPSTITKNGYLYIYVSNESPQDVFFDNVTIQHKKGPLLEETHYYPFGLTMAGISSKALKTNYAQNKKKFQGQELANKEFSDGSGLEMYEFKYRFHDPQIGRFWSIDPLADKYVYNSTYAFSENKVTAHVELEGLESFSIQDLWRSAGISSSSDPKEFVGNVGKEALKPSNWVAGAAQATQIAAPFILTTIMTGGFGDGAVLEAETQNLRFAPTPSGTLPAAAENLSTGAVEATNTGSVTGSTTTSEFGARVNSVQNFSLTPESNVSKSSPSFVVDSKGTAFPVPKGADGPSPVINPAGKQTGVAFTGGNGGANGKVSTMRIMNATPARGNSPGYPNGYIKYENAGKQGVDIYSGKTLPNSTSHHPINQ
ncbi:MAG: hypothetical protein NVS3B8_00190 [Chitinophagaceae bacterium]